MPKNTFKQNLVYASESVRRDQPGGRGGHRDRSGTDFQKIDVRGTSTKRSGWERVEVRDVFKYLKDFDDHLLAA